jgi:hypothetical protein
MADDRCEIEADDRSGTGTVLEDASDAAETRCTVVDVPVDATEHRISAIAAKRSLWREEWEDTV